MYFKNRKAQADIDGVVCVCKQVTERKIRKVVREGKRSFISVKQATEAGSGCGMCQPIVEDIIKDELSKLEKKPI
ncbi:MAG: (2Fe-2S)-binding protein [Candidatus Izimaplasma sp.]|nr:(2Fe-2S)-binding protein [Candidatus Izimaplasma bacterium]